MNKNIPKVFLGVVISSMALIGVSTAINQPKFDIIDIMGNKESLGDVKIISQSNESIYTTHKNTLSKDGFEVKPYTKSVNQEMKMQDIINLDEDFFKGYYDEYNIFKQGDVIGFIRYEADYRENQNIIITYTLNTKNIKTNEEERYVFESPVRFKENSNFDNSIYTMTQGEDIYLAELSVNDIDYNRSGDYVNNGQSTVNIYKLNLEKGKLEKYNEISSKDSEITYKRDIAFIYNDRFYFTVNKKVDDEKITSYIAYYDLNKNEFSYIEDSINLSKDIINNQDYFDLYKSNISDEVLNIVTNDNKNNDNMEIKQISIDLKTNKVLIKDNLYNVERLYKSTAIKEVKSIDGKLYIILTSIEPKLKDRDTSESIIVLDENTKKTLYIGQYKKDPTSYSNYLIVKDNEI